MSTHVYTDEQGRRITLILPVGAFAPRRIDIPMEDALTEFTRSDVLKAVNTACG